MPFRCQGGFVRAPLVVFLAAILFCTTARAEARIAVASNFRVAALALEETLRAQGGEPLTLLFGSTGKHFAQIVNGAPFDALLAADAGRPAELERRGLIMPGSRFTYAHGRLVLWSADPTRIDPEGDVLRSLAFNRLAVANPRLAPYGLAAMEVLRALDVEASVRDRLVIGENISQAYQFVHSENAVLGLVALSQVASHEQGSRWLVPARLHAPIEQQAVLLTEAAGAVAFLQFIRHPDGQAIIRRHGYEIPGDD
jgi:molybdate transport system substrate-binding protein